MKLTVEISADDAALASGIHQELEYVLLQVPPAPGRGIGSGTLRDSNGNTVGTWRWSDG